MNKTRPCVLNIAGFDPSGGAGLLADIKTFEQHKVQGMGVVTGLTFQNDSGFDGVSWIKEEEIIRQIEVLSRRFNFSFIKVGMVQHPDILLIISKLLTPSSKLIWDPILKASAGFEIHKAIDKSKIQEICQNIFLITPNVDEVRILTGEQDEMKAATGLSKFCNVLLKGGHNEKNKGKDHLFTTAGKIFPFKAKRIVETGKHGSGCVLSSAIAANLANGLSLQRACLKGKDYVTNFLTSNKTLLGYHKM